MRVGKKSSKVIGTQIAMARCGLGMSQRDMSRLARLNRKTIVLLERGDCPEATQQRAVDYLSRYCTFLREPGAFGVMIRDGAATEWRNEKDPARITAAGSESNATMMDTHSTATEADD